MDWPQHTVSHLSCNKPDTHLVMMLPFRSYICFKRFSAVQLVKLGAQHCWTSGEKKKSPQISNPQNPNKAKTEGLILSHWVYLGFKGA